MAAQAVYVGIDTSNYTTSLCVVDAVGEVVFEDRRLLKVPVGSRGLQQSDALFQHMVRLPDHLVAMRDALAQRPIRAVGVSSKPRPQLESYMPVFMPGVLAAQSLAVGAGARLWETTHQEGHIAAAVASAGLFVENERPFLVYHLSGGTTDLLWVKKQACGYEIRGVLTGLDLHVGQFVDRIGVAMGLPFPAGAQLEGLAAGAADGIPSLPSAIREGRPSFSGPLTAAEKLLAQGVPKEQVAASVFRVIANTLEKSVRYAMLHTGVERILFVGGVASNLLIRRRLRQRFGEATGDGTRLFFCDPKRATDNAYGVALIARECEQR